MKYLFIILLLPMSLIKIYSQEVKNSYEQVGLNFFIENVLEKEFNNSIFIFENQTVGKTDLTLLCFKDLLKTKISQKKKGIDYRIYESDIIQHLAISSTELNFKIKTNFLLKLFKRKKIAYLNVRRYIKYEGDILVKIELFNELGEFTYILRFIRENKKSIEICEDKAYY